jgi:hypothetical protein
VDRTTDRIETAHSTGFSSFVGSPDAVTLTGKDRTATTLLEGLSTVADQSILGAELTETATIRLNSIHSQTHIGSDGKR